ncbi:MAG TPA: hypothetical protein VK880_04760, partial [Anaerolineales bacterium]|nr:hypothetical protein [Anaerolineales bacterium]
GRMFCCQGQQFLVPGLADRFMCLPFRLYRFAFSLSDVPMAAGTFWLLLVERPFTTQSTKSGDT